MTLKLILSRHAKSSWASPAQSDHDRPLNDRGRKSASAIGHWLVSHGHVPQLVLTSSAERTRETAQRIVAEMSAAPEIRLDRKLYLATPDEMLNVLRQVDPVPAVLLIGHNPGTALMAQALAAAPPDVARFDHYPTGATTVFEFPVSDWGGVTRGTGQVVDFVVPRQLMD